MAALDVIAPRNYHREKVAGKWQKVGTELGMPGAVRPLMVGNWKMNLTPKQGVAHVINILSRCQGIIDVDFGFAPPYTGLDKLRDYLKPEFLSGQFNLGKNVLLVAQDIFFEKKGAFTGEISPGMLSDIGVDSVIIGHSDRRTNLGKYFQIGESVLKRMSPDHLAQDIERLKKIDGANPRLIEALSQITGESNRWLLDELAKHLAQELKDRSGESDDVIRKKVLATLGEGMDVILCCGENAEARAENLTFNVIDNQLTRALESVDAVTFRKKVALAYEPVWAIGEGKKPATINEIDDVHTFIRGLVEKLYGEEIAGSARLLYGGNVNGSNIGEIMNLPGVDGALVGGASLKTEDFSKIIRFGLPD